MTHPITRKQAATIVARVRLAIQSYIQKHNLAYAVSGRSDGLGSSVIAGLLSDLPRIRPIGFLMPMESQPQAERSGHLVLDHFQIPSIKVGLTAADHAPESRFYSS